MKRPKELVMYIHVEKVNNGWVDWDNKPTSDYIIKIPYWLGRAYERGRINLVKLIFQDKVPCGNIRYNEENFKEYFKENFSKKVSKMRGLNSNYMQVITEHKGNGFFKSQKDYQEYHKELKKLNDKYCSFQKDLKKKVYYGKRKTTKSYE